MRFGRLRVATSPKCLFMMTTFYLRECLGKPWEPTLKPPGTHCPGGSGSESLGPVCQPAVPDVRDRDAVSGSKKKTPSQTPVGESRVGVRGILQMNSYFAKHCPLRKRLCEACDLVLSFPHSTFWQLWAVIIHYGNNHHHDNNNTAFVQSLNLEINKTADPV